MNARRIVFGGDMHKCLLSLEQIPDLFIDVLFDEYKGNMALRILGRMTAENWWDTVA